MVAWTRRVAVASTRNGVILDKYWRRNQEYFLAELKSKNKLKISDLGLINSKIGIRTYQYRNVQMEQTLWKD